MLRRLILSFGLLLLALPMVSFAAGLVPCGGEGEMQCQWYHVPILINTVVDWLAAILTMAVVIILVYAGIRLVVSGGDPGARQTAKGYIVNALIGLVIVLAAWIIIDTVIKVLVSSSGNLPNDFGPWNEIPQVIILSPTDRGRISDALLFQGSETGGRQTYAAEQEGYVSGATLTEEQAAQLARSSDEYADRLCAEAANYASLRDRCDVLRALVAQESSGNPNAESSAGAAGLMQIMPGTARELAPAEFADLSDAEIKARLKADPDLSIRLGTEMLAGAVDVNESVDHALAAYNGGGRLGADCDGALCNSRDCPGTTQWQCPFDEPGCWDAQAQQPVSGANCKPNEGYAETRDYVSRINQFSQQYGG